MKGNKLIETRLKVGEVASLDVGIRKLTLGEGFPRVAILCNVHGNEDVSLLVASKVLGLELSRGSIDVVIVNELAQIFDRRFIHADLNRSFPGGDQGNFEQRVAKVTLEELKEYDLVIDMHSYYNIKTPITAIQFERENKFVQLFNPQQTWLIDSSKGFVNNLGQSLVGMGVNYFAVEMDRLDHFSEEDLSRVVFGIKNILMELDMIDGEAVSHVVRGLVRTEFNSDFAGIFIPKKVPLESVKEGEKVGEILSIKDFSKRGVVSKMSGQLMQIARKGKVKTGDLIFAIGEFV
jgi:predicted deacylase